MSPRPISRTFTHLYFISIFHAQVKAFVEKQQELLQDVATPMEGNGILVSDAAASMSMSKASKTSNSKTAKSAFSMSVPNKSEE